MRLSSFADTDSLYIDLSEESSVESREISEGVVLDYNAAGRQARAAGPGPACGRPFSGYAEPPQLSA